MVVAADQAGNGNFNAAPEVKQTITVSAASPSIRWAQPAAIGYGTNLGGVLNASASSGGTNVLGTFTYSSNAATLTPTTILSAGSYTLGVNFTPADTTRYAAANGTVSLVVNKAAATVTLTAASNAVLVGNALNLQATVASAAGVPSGSITFLNGTTTLGTASLSGGTASLPIATLPVGIQTLTAVYSGDGNFNGNSSAALTETVQDFSVGSPDGTQAVSNGTTASYSFGVGPSGGVTFPSAVTFSVSGLPPGATATFTPQSIAAGSPATNVTLNMNFGQQGAVVPFERPSRRLPPVTLALIIIPVAAGFSRRRRSFKHLLGQLGCLVLGGFLLIGALGLAGCGGGSPSSTPTQPPHTYTITITATSGSLSHSTTITVAV